MSNNNDNVDINNGVVVITEEVELISTEMTNRTVTQRSKLRSF